MLPNVATSLPDVFATILLFSNCLLHIALTLIDSLSGLTLKSDSEIRIGISKQIMLFSSKDVIIINLYWPCNFWTPKQFGLTFFGPNIFLDQNLFGLKIFLDPNLYPRSCAKSDPRLPNSYFLGYLAFCSAAASGNYLKCLGAASERIRDQPKLNMVPFLRQISSSEGKHMQYGQGEYY